jgi:hypothetical protein
MTRTPLSILGAFVLAIFLASNAAQLPGQAQPFQTQPAQAPASQALVGTWSTTYNWHLPSGLLINTTFMSDGQIQSTIQNHMGMSYTLAGVYQFNAAQSTLSFTWKDYSPKQTCVDGACTPAQPYAKMGVVTTSTIRFLSATQFVATSNGASTTYVRTNAAGFPAP